MQRSRAHLLTGRFSRFSLIADASGLLTVEALLALMLIGYAFFFTWLIGELAAADLVLARAASAASREAAVVLADDSEFYGDHREFRDGEAVLFTSDKRQAAIEAVARRVLSAAPRFESLKLELAFPSGTGAPVVLLDTTLTAEFRCMGGSLSIIVCGASGRRTFSATARNVVHVARYPYALASPTNRATATRPLNGLGT